tara:strand:+ start:3071 stop:4309 length:1239 start_codon:yes stop_codon:yes gene_type:complete
MGKNLIINENQLGKIVDKLLLERLGVPDFILDSAEVLYDIVLNKIRTIKGTSGNYDFNLNVDLPIGDFDIRRLELTISTEEIEGYDGGVDIAGMGVAQQFKFDNAVLMKILDVNHTLELEVSYVVPEEWKPSELYDVFVKDKINVISIFAHELKHKYDKTKKTKDLIGRDAEYQVFSRQNLNFGIPVIGEFMRYSYFIQNTENLVRPTEVASRMSQKNITKDQFDEFLRNDVIYKELVDIKNFTFDSLMLKLNQQMDRVDGLLNHAGQNISDMDEEEKIKKVLTLVYINIVNGKVDIFDDMTSNDVDLFSSMSRLMGIPFLGKSNDEKDKVRRKFINHVAKYEDNPIKFFVDECERFNYISTKVIKKLGKLYDMAKDKEQTNESIINWDLHQQLMEKKYGKRKIDTDYKFKR